MRLKLTDYQKDIPQKGEPFQLANRTKNYETVVPNFGDNVS